MKKNIIISFVFSMLCMLNLSAANNALLAPVAKPATNITPLSFTANWEVAAGAVGYYIDIYSYKAEERVQQYSIRMATTEAEREYLVQDDFHTATTCSVENLNPEVTYYYTVRATDGVEVSEESNEIKVEIKKGEIAAPVLLPATNITDNGFTANWESVPGVNVYWLYLLETYTAQSDEVHTILYEDFSKVTHGTLSQPVVGALEEDLSPYTNTPGWEAIHPIFARGMLGMSAVAGDFPSVILSPRMDLSANDGKFTVEINTLSRPGDEMSVIKECFDALHSEPVDNRKIILDTERKNTSVEFQHVNPDAIGGIDLLFETKGNIIFMDDIKITKTLRTGDSFSIIYFGIIASSNASVMSVPIEIESRPGYRYGYSVVVSKSIDDAPFMDFFGFENKMYIDGLPTSVPTNYTSTDKIYIHNGDLCVTLEDPSLIEVYDISGKMVMNNYGMTGENIIPLINKGLYIVKTQNTTVKIVK